MTNHSILYILLSCLLVLPACQRHDNQQERVAELEDSALVSGVEVRDSLLQVARSIVNDSISDHIRGAIRARDLGAEEKYDSSNAILKKVEGFCARQKPSKRVYNLWAYVENTLGTNLLYSNSSGQGNLDSALTAFKKAIRYSSLSGNRQRLVLAYYNLSCIFVDKSDYANAAFYIQRALFTADSLKMSFRRVFFLTSSLGSVYRAMGDYKSAQDVYDKAAKNLSRMSPDDKWFMYQEYGNLYYELKDMPRALRYYRMALTEAQKANVARQSTYYSLVRSYADVEVTSGKATPQTKERLEEALRFFTNAQNNDELLKSRTTLLKLAVREKDKDGALENIKAVQRLEMTPDGLGKEARMDWYRALDSYYRAAGDYKKAYVCSDKAAALNDSIYGFRRQQYVANLNLKYRQDTTLLNHRVFIARQEAEIESLHGRYYAAVLAAVVIICLFAGYYFYMRHRRSELYHTYIMNINRLKMQNIRNCISPHFTFNVLNHEIELDSASGEKRGRLTNLARLLRKSLDTADRVAVPLLDELDFVASYVTLLNECGKHFTYALHLAPAVDASSILIPSMIVQIPVENAVKHGFLKDNPAHFIHINVKAAADGTNIEILNNGVPYSPFTQVDKARCTGLGMKVVFQSLLILNERNKSKITFTVSDYKDGENTGTRVLIHIPSHFDYSGFGH